MTAGVHEQSSAWKLAPSIARSQLTRTVLPGQCLGSKAELTCTQSANPDSPAKAVSGAARRELTWKRARGSMVRIAGLLRSISSSTRPMLTTAFTLVRPALCAARATADDCESVRLGIEGACTS